MTLIGTSAYFMIEKGTNVGRVVFPEGNKSAALWSKRSGKIVILIGLEEGILTEDEAKMIRNMIESSLLPNEDPMDMIRQGEHQTTKGSFDRLSLFHDDVIISMSEDPDVGSLRHTQRMLETMQGKIRSMKERIEH